MRWLLAMVIGLAGGVAAGHSVQAAASGKTVTGKVVSVPDGGSVWIYLEESHASYHFLLTGVTAPAVDQPGGTEARQTLSNLLQGCTVRVVVDQLNDDRPNLAQVFLDGRSVNQQMVQVLSADTAGQALAVRTEAPPRRPLLTFLCSVLRLVVP